MATSLAVLESTRLWGGVKIPLRPALIVPSSINVVVTRAFSAPTWALVITYQTNTIPETTIDVIDTLVVLNLPAGTSYLEFRVSYPDQPQYEYPTAAMDTANPIIFTLTVDPGNTVFTDFGTRQYSVHMKTLRSINGPKLFNEITSTPVGDMMKVDGLPVLVDGNPIYFPTNQDGSTLSVTDAPFIPPENLDTTYRAFYAVIKCQMDASIMRDRLVKFTDINDRPFTDGLSEGDLGLYTWDATHAPWPAFSSSSNVLGSDYVNGQNFMVYYSTSSSQPPDVRGTLVPATGDFVNGFIIPAAANYIVLRRVYLFSSVAIALSNAQVTKPTAYALGDCIVATVKDAGIHHPSMSGPLLRAAYKTRLALSVLP